MSQKHRIKRSRIIFAVALLAILACPRPLQAQQPQPQPQPPPPAANSQDGEFIGFDFFVGGVNYGVIYGYFSDGWFQTAQPEDALLLLPAVKNPDHFLPLLQGRIEKIRHVKNVGTVRVDTDNFSLSLEVDRAETVLSTVSDLGKMTGTETDLSLRNYTFVAGSSGTETLDLLQNVSLTHDTVLSKGSGAFQSTGTLTQDNGYDLTNALLRKDFTAFDNDMTGYLGLLQTSGNLHFAKSLDYTGLRAASNPDLLFRDKQLLASDLQIFLPRRAQVEVYRQSEGSGQVLYSRIMEFGTAQLDTRSFPQGSYDIEIVVRDGSAVLSRETRPFIKTEDLPPHGKPVLSLDIGEIRDDLSGQGIGIVEASYGLRLSDSLGGRIGVSATPEDQVYETTLSWQKPLTLFKSIGLLQSSLTGAVDGGASPAGIAASALWRSPKASFGVNSTKSYLRTVTGNAAGSLALSDRQSTSFNLSMPVNIGRYRIYSALSAEFSQSAATGSDYRYGPVFSYTFDEVSGYTPTFKVEYSKSQDEQRAMATLSLRNTDPVWTKTAETTAARAGADVFSTAYASLGYNGKASAYDDWRRRLDLSIGLRLDPLTSSTGPMEAVASGSLQYTAETVQMRSYFDQGLNVRQGQVGGELDSTLLWTAKSGITATAQGAPKEMALVMVSLQGDADQPLDITVNGATRAQGRAGDRIVLSVPPYETTRIHVQDREGKGALKTQEEAQTIIGYPGNVAYRVFNIVRSVVMIGTLKDEKGEPLSLQRFILNDTAYYTDETGFFTLEDTLQSGGMLLLEGFGFTCAFKMPEIGKDESLVDFGDIPCKEKPGPP